MNQSGNLTLQAPSGRRSTLEAKPDFKYAVWAQRFRERIASGELTIGARLPSYNDLRSYHGLSRATADQVFETLESEGLIVREAGRGVFVAAPQLEQAADTVCVVCDGFGEYEQHPYYAQLIGAVHRAARRDGMRILLCGGDTLPDTERLGGVLQIAPLRNMVQELIRELPVGVSLVSVLAACPEAPAVVADEGSGIRGAVFHLLQQRHRRIALLASENKFVPDREVAWRNALLEAGIPPHEAWLRIMAKQAPVIPYEQLGYLSMKEWLADGWEKLGVTALLCHNDDTAAGVLRALSEAGIRVPDDLSLVGFDGTQIADYANPRLTTVEMPLAAMVLRAWEMLRARAHLLPDERPAPETVMLPTKLRVAQSTAPPKSK
jgi:DNA-binding LacI/PurR family transcriptional regulator